MLEQRYKRLSIAAAAGVLVMLILVWLCSASAKRTIEERTEKAELLANRITSQIEHIISDKMLYTHALESLAIRDTGEIVNFQIVAEKIACNDRTIKCLQFAKDGVITPETIYPYEGNENGVGNLLSPNSPRYEAALYALSRRTTVASIPKDGKLHQGGNGIIARTPIFLEDETGKERFWGFIVIIIDLNKLLEQADLYSLASSYDYSLSALDEDGKRIILAGAEELSSDSVTSTAEAHETSLKLLILPKGGWLNASDKRNYILTTIEFSGLVFSLVLLYLKSRSKNDRYKKLSIRDSLVGCYNKHYFEVKMEEYINKEIPFILYIFDVNRFKNINDSNGHNAGDTILFETAQRLSSVLKAADALFRIGGDEFAVISFITKKEDSKILLKQMLDAVEKPIRYDNNIFEVSLSYGSASYPTDAQNAERLKEIADVTMYQQKHASKKSFPLSGRDHFLLAIKNIIRKGINDGENTNYYFFHVDYRNFKYINYYYGVEEGNSLVMRTIEHIKKHQNCVLCVNNYADSIFFLVKTKPETSRETVELQFCEYIRELLKTEQPRYDTIMLSLWCGYAKINRLNISDAVGRANIGRVKAKRENIKQPVFIDEEQAKCYMLNSQLEFEAILSIKDGRIFYHLQPQMDVESGKMVSAEVLGGLIDRAGKTILPERFLAALEANGRIIEYDLAVLDLVCRDLKERLDAGRSVVPLSVALSGLHISKGGSVQKMKEIIEKHGVPANMLCFEIKQTLPCENTQRVSEFCQELHDMGARISLDGLGAGDTGLGLIGEVSVDEIKLDRTFLHEAKNKKSRQLEIMKILVDMAKKMNIRVVCEGVENHEQFEQVKEIGVSLIQGQYEAKPDAPEKIYDQFL